VVSATIGRRFQLYRARQIRFRALQVRFRQLQVVSRRIASMKHPGRPRLDETDTTIQVNFRLPSREYDRLCAKAQHARVSLNEFIRRQLPRDITDSTPRK
jgi:hypothetical protein